MSTTAAVSEKAFSQTPVTSHLQTNDAQQPTVVQDPAPSHVQAQAQAEIAARLPGPLLDSNGQVAVRAMRNLRCILSEHRLRILRLERELGQRLDTVEALSQSDHVVVARISHVSSILFLLSHRCAHVAVKSGCVSWSSGAVLMKESRLLTSKHA